MPIDIDHAGRTLLIVAHPDDEAVGCGSVLHRVRNLYIAYVTDGSPENLYDAHRNGFATREEYASARRAEASAAVPHAEMFWLGFTDQKTAHQMDKLTEAVSDLIDRVRPDLVLTHPYEGGHPDHDAVAFAVHAAYPTPWEFTSYHANPDFVAEEFLPPHDDVLTIELTPEDRARKRGIMECYRTQQEVLRLFPLRYERFRPAPKYDFEKPPHPGQLHYERFDWGITGQQFRRNVCALQS